MEFSLEEYKTNGVKLNYYYICKRKLWLFDKGISFENSNGRILHGKILHVKYFIGDEPYKSLRAWQ